MSNPTESGETEAFLRASGITCYEDLFVDLPDALAAQVVDPAVMSRRHYAASVSSADGPVYLGAGFYDHNISSAVDSLADEVEFRRVNASDGAALDDILASAVHRFHRLVCQLAGTPAVDLAFYRSGDALSRACRLAVEATGRKLIVAPETLPPERLALLRAHAAAGIVELRVVPALKGLTNLESFYAILQSERGRVAAAIAPYPNYCGLLERVGRLSDATQEAGALFIMGVDPVALAILRSPADWGADLVAGDVHTTPLRKNDGDVRLGFVAASERFLAMAPKNFLTCFVDSSGNYTYFLPRSFGGRASEFSGSPRKTRAIGALRTLIHLAGVRIQELRHVAEESHRIATYARKRLRKAGFEFQHDAPFLREFAVKVDDPKGMLAYLDKWGLVGGVELSDGLLLAFTEKRCKEEINELAYFMKDYRDRAQKDAT